MPYVRRTWQNAPSSATPLNAAALNNIENGVEEALDAIADLPATYVAIPAGGSTGQALVKSGSDVVWGTVEGSGGGNIRLDALAAGQRLKAELSGNESELAQGVTVSAMVAPTASSAVSLGSATFTDAGDIITTPAAHGLSVGDAVSFGTVTSTTGITAGDVYFVLTVPSSTTFTISGSPGGATRTLTTDGSTVAVYRRERAFLRQTAGAAVAVTVTASTDRVTFPAPHGLSASQGISFSSITGAAGLVASMFVKSVIDSRTITVSTTAGGALVDITTDGTATATPTGIVNPALRVSETRAVVANANYPRFESIGPDPSIITYAPGSPVGTDMRVETDYSGSVLGIVARNNASTSTITVYVDGLRATVIDSTVFTAASITSGNSGIVTLTFPNARKRNIVLEFEGSIEFPGFAVQAGSPLFFPTTTLKGARVLISGDSFTEGTGRGSSRGYVRWLTKLMGWRDVWKAGSGSTGYTSDGARLALIDRYVNDIVAQRADTVIIAQGLNDSALTLATVVADATTIWDAVLASSYTRELIIVGPWPNSGGSVAPTAGIAALDSALAALAVTKGVRYISPVQEGWTFTLADATHPDPAGHEYIAWRLAGHLSVPYIAA